MLSVNRILSFILAGSALVWSCSVSQPRQYEIDQLSPDGSYRVKVMVKRGEPGKTLDEAKFQFFVGKEVVHSWDWKQVDQYEEAFDSFLPMHWVGEQILEIGAVSNNAGFFDELNVTNTSEEYLRYVSISYSKTNIFKIFELAPGKRIDLRVVPTFTVKGDEFSFGYGGRTRTGRRFSDVVKIGERVHPDGPKKISITISPEVIAKTKN